MKSFSRFVKVFALAIVLLTVFGLSIPHVTLVQAAVKPTLTPGPMDLGSIRHGPLPPGRVVQAGGVWSVIHTQDFEGAFPAAGWIVKDLSADGFERFWDDDDYRAHLGGWAAWPARGGVNGRDPVPGIDNYYNDMDTRMIYGPFDLSNATQADTDFYLWLATQSPNDYLSFEISHDGINFVEVPNARWSGAAASWQFEDIYYNNYVGDSSVWVAWHFHSDSSLNDDGPWVDDIHVWKYASLPFTPTPLRSPTRTATRLPSHTPTRTLVPSITRTPTRTLTRTLAFTKTKTRTPTKTATRTATHTPTNTATRTLTRTASRTPTICPLTVCTRTPTRTLTRTKTVCPLTACTATPTRTLTRTVTRTPTHTITRTPTITPTPNSNGSGACWESGLSWANYVVYYDIASNVPTSWIPSIEAAAQTWNNVSPSHFSFSRQAGSNNTVRYEVPNDPKNLAASAPPPSIGFLTIGYTKINPNYTWDTNNSFPSSTDYNVQNVMTHEFGHWLLLKDINDANCTQVTMDFSVGQGEVNKITLDAADINGINWQYP